MADVSQQVTLSLLTEFENHSILKPSHDNPTGWTRCWSRSPLGAPRSRRCAPASRPAA
jgi:hypothetical protein